MDERSGSQLRLFDDMLPVVIRKIIGVCMVFLATGTASVSVTARDWPQWRGADRLAIWDETGIVETLPKELKVSWRVPLGSGYAGPAVANGRVFITDWKEDPESRTMDGKERLLVLDEETGHLLWTFEWATTYRMLMTTYAIGPRRQQLMETEFMSLVRRDSSFVLTWIMAMLSGRKIMPLTMTPLSQRGGPVVLR